MSRIDAHQHYWRIGHHGQQWPTPDLAAIHRDFLPGDLEPLLRGAGVAGSVLVQSQPCDADTEWLLTLAADTASVAAVVGWADLAAVGAPARVAALAGRPKLRGLRPMLQALPDGWIDGAGVRAAAAAMARHRLVFDALVRADQLPALARFAADHPELAIVVDHAAKPAIAAGDFDGWARDIAAIARAPQVHCKLSGLATEAGADWRAEDLAPYVAHLLSVFGPERLIWGSDWPVLLLAGDYAGWLAVAERLVGGLSDRDQAAVFGGNARRVYRIG